MSVQKVKLIADTGYIPVMYAVVGSTIGATLAGSYAWLETIGYGIDLEAELDVLKLNKSEGTVADFSVLNGTKGAYSIAALSAISEYSAPDSFIYMDKNLGTI